MLKKESINGKLISFSVPSPARDAKDLPNRIKLLKWGVNETVKGPVRVGKNTLAQLGVNQKALGFEEIALDYNHQTVPSSPTYKPDPVDVAAYGSPEVVENDGLYINMSRWTPSGREFTPSYQDLSPTPQLDENGEVIFLHSVALVRQGCVEGLSLYSASFYNPTSLKTLSSMDYRLAIIQLLTTLGVTLPENPTDAEIADAASKAKPGTNLSTMSAAEIEKIIDKKLTPLSGKFEENERTALIALASSQGKVIPLTDDLLKTFPLTTLSAMITALPVTVPLSERGKPAKEENRKLTTLSADQRKICKNLRIPEDKYLTQLNADKPADVVLV